MLPAGEPTGSHRTTRGRKKAVTAELSESAESHVNSSIQPEVALNNLSTPPSDHTEVAASGNAKKSPTSQRPSCQSKQRAVNQMTPKGSKDSDSPSKKKAPELKDALNTLVVSNEAPVDIVISDIPVDEPFESPQTGSSNTFSFSSIQSFDYPLSTQRDFVASSSSFINRKRQHGDASTGDTESKTLKVYNEGGTTSFASNYNPPIVYDNEGGTTSLVSNYYPSIVHNNEGGTTSFAPNYNPPIVYDTSEMNNEEMMEFLDLENLAYPENDVIKPPSPKKTSTVALSEPNLSQFVNQTNVSDAYGVPSTIQGERVLESEGVFEAENEGFIDQNNTAYNANNDGNNYNYEQNANDESLIREEQQDFMNMPYQFVENGYEDSVGGFYEHQEEIMNNGNGNGHSIVNNGLLMNTISNPTNENSGYNYDSFSPDLFDDSGNVHPSELNGIETLNDDAAAPALNSVPTAFPFNNFGVAPPYNNFSVSQGFNNVAYAPTYNNVAFLSSYNNVAVPSTYNNNAVPPTYNNVAVPSTYNSNAVPPTYNNVAVRPTYNNVAVPSTYNSNAVPPTYNNVAVRPTYNNVAVPPTYNSNAVPSTYNNAVFPPTYNSVAVRPTYNNVAIPPALNNVGFAPALNSIPVAFPLNNVAITTPEIQVSKQPLTEGKNNDAVDTIKNDLNGSRLTMITRSQVRGSRASAPRRLSPSHDVRPRRKSVARSMSSAPTPKKKERRITISVDEETNGITKSNNSTKKTSPENSLVASVAVPETQFVPVADTYVPVTETQVVPVADTQVVPVKPAGNKKVSTVARRKRKSTVAETQIVPVTETQVVPVTETQFVNVANTHVPVSDTQGVPLDDTQVVPVKPAGNKKVSTVASRKKKSTVTETQVVPVSDTQVVPVADTQVVPVKPTRNKKASTVASRKRKSTVAETQLVPVTETQVVPVTETQVVSVTETQVVPVADTQVVPVKPTRNKKASTVAIRKRKSTVAETQLVPVTETQVVPVTETQVVPVTETQVVPVTETQVVPVADTQVVPVADTQVVPVADTQVVPVKPARNKKASTVASRKRKSTVAETQLVPVTETQVVPVTETQVVPVADTQVVPVKPARNKKASTVASRKRKSTVAETQVVPVTETQFVAVADTHVPVTETQVVPVADTQVVPIADTQVVPVKPARNKKASTVASRKRKSTVTETQVVPVADTHVPVAETQVVPVTETQVVPVADTQVVPVKPARNKKASTVASKKKRSTVAETQLVPVTETQVVPVTETQVVPVDDTHVVPVSDTQVVPVADTQVVPVKPAGNKKVSTVASRKRKSTVAETQVVPVTETQFVNVANTHVSVSDTQVVPVKPAGNKEVSTVASKKKRYTVAETQLVPVTETQVVPVTETQVVPVDDTQVVSVDDTQVVPLDDTQVVPVKAAEIKKVSTVASKKKRSTVVNNNLRFCPRNTEEDYNMKQAMRWSKINEHDNLALTMMLARRPNGLTVDFYHSDRIERDLTGRNRHALTEYNRNIKVCVVCLGRRTSKVIKCTFAHPDAVPCNRFVHPECSKKMNFGGYILFHAMTCQGFCCPDHHCTKCFATGCHRTAFVPKAQLINCFACASQYHPECIPAGCTVTTKKNKNYIICPRHYQLPKQKVLEKCFECNNIAPGKLINCSNCVRSFHKKCHSILGYTTGSAFGERCSTCFRHDFSLVGDLVVAEYRRGIYHLARVVDNKCLPDGDRLLPGFCVVEIILQRSKPVYLAVSHYRLYAFVENSLFLGFEFRKKMNELPFKMFKDVTEEHLAKNGYSRKALQKYANSEMVFNSRYKEVDGNKYRKRELPRENSDVIAEMCCCETDANNLRCLSHCVNRVMKIECPQECNNLGVCTNRYITNKEDAMSKNQIEVFPTETCGFGLRALVDIKQDTYIGEYCGDVINKEEMLDVYRYQDVWKSKEFGFYIMGIAHLYIDAQFSGSVMRYMNHSCDPNCHAYSTYTEEGPHICLFAVKDIKAGDELTFSYTSNASTAFSHKFACKCGAAKCTGLFRA